MDKNSLHNRIYTYSGYLKNRYGGKVFRLGLSIGKICPHRLQSGGCIFCNPKAFTGSYQRRSLSIHEQIKQAIPNVYDCCGKVKLLAYFQDETSTACSLEEMKKIMEETLLVKEIIGVILSTRPDYLKKDFIAYFKSLQVPFTIEIGMQSIHDKRLHFLQRGHTFAQIKEAIDMCGEADIEVGVHLILGIPGETIDEMKETIDYVSENPIIKQVKFHNLVIYKNTQLYKMYQKNEAPIFTIENHIETLAKLLPHLRGDIVITRLFTSNILNQEPTAHFYEGNKTKWMNQLRLLLEEKEIVQGMKTHIQYAPKEMAV